MTVTITPIEDIRVALDDIQDRRGMSAGIDAMRTRREMFRDDLEMMLTGVGIIPDARRMLNDALTRAWSSRSRNPYTDYSDREVLIGAGFAAAVYAATRVAMGFPRPIVLDAAPAAMIGGAFTIGDLSPAFWLNSGNRPGTAGNPGNVSAALNYLPGAPVQPSMLSGREYHTNSDMAFSIRLALMQNACVFPNEKVTSVDPFRERTLVHMDGGLSFFAGRVVDLRGLGEPSDADQANGETIFTFPQFMQRMGATPFPLANLGRVAVRGDGDSAKCAVEALLGIGPSTGMSVAGMDFLQEITWFAPSLPQTCQEWRRTERGRNQRIGSYLRREGDPFGNSGPENSTRRLKVVNERAFLTPTLGGVLVNDQNFDTVITCTGNKLASLVGPNAIDLDLYRVNELDVGRQSGNGYYMAGVAADLPFTGSERRAGFDQVAANKVAMFRQGPKLSAMAASFGAI